MPEAVAVPRYPAGQEANVAPVEVQIPIDFDGGVIPFRSKPAPPKFNELPPAILPVPVAKQPSNEPRPKEEPSTAAKKRATESPRGARYSQISLNILRYHGPRLKKRGAFLALLVMEDLIHGLGKHGAAVAQKKIGEAMGGVTTRSVRNYLKLL